MMTKPKPKEFLLLTETTRKQELHKEKVLCVACSWYIGLCFVFVLMSI